MDSASVQTCQTGKEKAKKPSKVILIGIVISVLILLGVAGLFGIRYYKDCVAAGWHQREEGTCYRFSGQNSWAKGIVEIEGNLYCFGNDTYLLYGWIQFGDKVYYADESGVLARGACTLDGKVRYFDETTGALLNGWKEEGQRYYLADGTMATGYQTIDGIEYKFSDDGKIYEGLDETDKGIRLYTSKGLAEGLHSIENATYYFRDTYMQYGQQEIGGNWYYFGEDGAMQTGWLLLDGKKYYYNESGIKLTGTQAIGDETYYLQPDGELLTGKVTRDGVTYYYSEYGEKLTGTQVIGGKTYYLQPDGELLTGRVTRDGVTYYYSEYGEKLTGTQNIDGETYYLTPEGTLLKGWVTKNGSRYYYSSRGKMLTGWQTIDKKRYYFGEDGVMAANTQIGMYSIDSDGVASKAPANADNLNAYLDDILNTYGRTPEAIHHAVNSMIKYKTTPEGEIVQMACDAINTGRGACWNYASLGYLLLQRAGYEVYYVCGVSQKGNPHRWLYVHFSDGWYHLDSVKSDRAKLTDEQFEALTFIWDKTALPTN